MSDRPEDVRTEWVQRLWYHREADGVRDQEDRREGEQDDMADLRREREMEREESCKPHESHQ
jgi:hypothetical protein